MHLTNQILRKVTRKKVLGRLCLLNVLLLCFLTPLTSALPVFLPIDSYYYNLFLRFIYASLSIYIFIASFAHRESSYISVGGWLLGVFWIIYSIRFLHDTLVEGLVIRGNIFKLYAITFGNCLMPALANLRAARYVDKLEAMTMIRGALIASCVSVIIVMYKIHGTLNPAVLGRVRFTVESESGSTYSILNSITIGFQGESMTLTALALLLFGQKSASGNFFNLLGLVLGLFTLLLSASRGPALGTAVGVFLMLITYLYYFKKTSLRLLKVGLFSFLSLIFTQLFIVPRLMAYNLTLFNRLGELSDNLSSTGNGTREVRSYQWESALNMFLENMIVGDRYLERYANFYPHNVYLEVFMATGVVGAVFFYGMLFVAFYILLKCIWSKSSTVILFWPFFAILMWMFTSGSIFEGVALWTFLTFWMGINTGVRSRIS